MPEWIVKYWVEWAFGAVLTMIGFIWKHFHGKIKKEIAAREALEMKQKEENEALKAGMRSLLRRQIIADCKQAMADGYCDETVRDTISGMYEAYHALGGNGTVTDAYESMKRLPLMAVNP